MVIILLTVVLIIIMLVIYRDNIRRIILIGGIPNSKSFSHNLRYKSKTDDSAAIIHELNMFIIDVIENLKGAIVGGQIEPEYLYFARNLVDKYDPTVVVEGYGENGDTSYVINKGHLLTLCLRNRHGQFHDMSLLKFVALHEISHIGSIQYNHGDEFWANFKWLLHFVADRDIYTPVNYAIYPVEYCKNVYLQDNPYFV